MLIEVKKALRISHNALDDDIIDLIDAARHDLMLSGISALKVQVDNQADDMTNVDPLIKRAIIIYVKAQSENDVDKAERYQLSYDLLKNHLSLTSDYTEGDEIV